MKNNIITTLLAVLILIMLTIFFSTANIPIKDIQLKNAGNKVSFTGSSGLAIPEDEPGGSELPVQETQAMHEIDEIELETEIDYDIADRVDYTGPSEVIKQPVSVVMPTQYS
jgi:hypothetical protein